jgi:hypothetical protein
MVQLRGTPLSGGRLEGGTTQPLERASGGDTPVLSFRTALGPVRLLLDTGASSSLITPALAARLRLPATALDSSRFELAGGGEGCAALKPLRTRLPVLEMGDAASGRLQLVGLEALVLPVAALPPGVEGVLGAPSLRQLPIRIEPAANRLALGPPALLPPLPAGPTPQRLPLRWQRGVPLLRLQPQDGGASVEALADTGAEGVFLSPALAARLEPRGPAEALRLVGFCGEQRVVRQPFSGLALVGARPGRGPIEGILTVNPIFRQLGVEAIVGQELLRDVTQLWRLDLTPPRLELTDRHSARRSAR